MKAIVLAGGSGTRLYPTTEAINKHLLPIYNKPMIYYPLSLVMSLNIREILIIVNPEYIENFQKLLGDGSQLGIKILYRIQEKPKGLAEGLLLAKDFIGNDKIVYLLGDNIFYGFNLGSIFSKALEEIKIHGGAYIFAYPVKDHHRFGIVEIDNKGEILSIKEKPQQPKSNYAITGFYIFDSKAVEFAEKIEPSKRGELEITSVLEKYLKYKTLKVKLLEKEIAWFDTGTYNSLLEASNFVANLEKNMNTCIGCPEVIAYKKGWISKKQLIDIASKLKNTDYGSYLFNLINS